MNKILVTGADGFIGSHLVEKLVSSGYNVKAFVLYNSQNSWGWLDHVDKSIKDEIEVISGDIRDPFLLSKVLNDCEIVYHLAALIAIPYSYISPISYIKTNIIGTLNLLEAAKNKGVKKFIHTSTSEIYGTAKYVPIDENHPINSQSPYAASKTGADQLVLSYFKSFNLPAVILRPFNTYGPRQSNRAIIPTVITQILKGNNKIKVGNIHPTRDFTYIDDTVNGFICALKSKNIEGKVLNLGAGFEISIKETITIIAKLIGTDIEIITDLERIRSKSSEVDRLYSNNSLASEILNWQPIFKGVEGFKTGLKKSIDWFSDKKNLSKYNSSFYNI